MTSSAAPPHVLPVPVLRIDGADPPAALTASLGAVRVRQAVSSPTACELEFDLHPDVPLPAAGAEVSLSLGAASDPLFSGEVVAVEHVLSAGPGARVRLRCLDRSHRLRDVFTVTGHVEVTVAEITRRLASEVGLGVDADAEGPLWAHVVQPGESALAFLDRLTARAALWWHVDGETLILRSRQEPEERPVRWGQDLVEASVTEGYRPEREVRAHGWDPSEPGPVEGAWGAGDSRPLLCGVLPEGDHAPLLARGSVERAASDRLRLRAVLLGDPAWRPGVALRLEGGSGAPAGPYWLTSVEHVLDAASGYLCLVDSAPPPEPPHPAPDAAGFTLAEVSDVADPAGLGRVRCTVAAWDGVTSGWLPVVSPGAGADKGLVAQPDVGDTVVILHPLGIPLQGIVLGGLFRPDAPPGGNAGVRDGGVRDVGWTTPDGQALRLERDADAATLVNGAGSRLRLAAEGVHLHAAADLVIEAPGRRIVLRADAIDLERG